MVMSQRVFVYITCIMYIRIFIYLKSILNQLMDRKCIITFYVHHLYNILQCCYYTERYEYITVTATVISVYCRLIVKERTRRFTVPTSCTAIEWRKRNAKMYPKVSGLSAKRNKQQQQIDTRWEATQRVMAAKLTRLTHKIAIQLHILAESCTICSSRSKRPVRKLFNSPSYTINAEQPTSVIDHWSWNLSGGTWNTGPLVI
jgi:hypothetical protein